MAMSDSYECGEYLADIYERLLDYYTSEEADLWLQSPHPQLDMKLPEDVIGQNIEGYKQVSEVLNRLDSDNYI